ncbi:MAG: hypothetical protein ABNH17_05460 [Paracoccus sp. (in: a-proteobacteria)]|jgi:hypothetical protein|uniref:hypothetical protein n=1 Tax=Paracoccus sp. TaxID=267 RepID=UPI0032D97AAC
MSERKWTPGPWAIDFSSIISKADALPAGRVHGYGCGNDFVADLNDGEYHEYTDRDEQDANAHLIAAAPDLYEALDKVNRWFNGAETEIGMILREANVALKKARGQA